MILCVDLPTHSQQHQVLDSWESLGTGCLLTSTWMENHHHDAEILIDLAIRVDGSNRVSANEFQTRYDL